MADAHTNREKRIFSALFALTKVANTEISDEGLLRAIAREVLDVMGANSCSVMLLDETRTVLKSKAAAGLTREEEDGITFVVGEGVAGLVAATGHPAVIGDASSDSRFARKDGQVLAIGSLACTPLVLRGEVIGVITVTHANPGHFHEDDVQVLAVFGNSIVLDMENARLYKLAVTDPLTKAFNRQYLFKKLPDEIERARRYGDALSLILYDIDSFKSLNDQNGHQAGDHVLQRLTTIVRQDLRETDTLVRWGGDEFIVILPRCDAKLSIQMAERLVTRVASAAVPWGGRELTVTLSIGIASLTPEIERDEELIARADLALYAAKNRGRNCAVEVGTLAAKLVR